MSTRRAHFERDGFVVARNVVDADMVTLLRRHVDALDMPPNGLVPLRLDTDAAAQDIAQHPTLLALAGELLDADVEVFGATYVVKRAGSPWQVSWHQDGEPWQRQWGIEHAVTLWLALDPTGPHNGGLRMISGSHRQPLRPLQRVDDAFDVFGWASPASLVDEANAVDLVLEAGDVSAHHPVTVHASGPNPSPHPRRALSLRYRTAAYG